MDRYAFLTQEWVDAAKQIREEYGHLEQGVPPNVRVNQVITEVPFGDGTVHAFVDTSSGQLEMDLGHLERADATVTLGYDTARAVFVDGTPQAAMAAFLDGKIRVQGDMAKLMQAMQQITPPQGSALAEVQERIKDITE